MKQIQELQLQTNEPESLDAFAIDSASDGGTTKLRYGDLLEYAKKKSYKNITVDGVKMDGSGGITHNCVDTTASDSSETFINIGKQGAHIHSVTIDREKFIQYFSPFSNKPINITIRRPLSSSDTYGWSISIGGNTFTDFPQVLAVSNQSLIDQCGITIEKDDWSSGDSTDGFEVDLELDKIAKTINTKCLNIYQSPGAYVYVSIDENIYADYGMSLNVDDGNGNYIHGPILYKGKSYLPSGGLSVGTHLFVLDEKNSWNLIGDIYEYPREMGGATAESSGYSGYVPAPKKGMQTAYLTGAGKWEIPSAGKGTVVGVEPGTIGNPFDPMYSFVSDDSEDPTQFLPINLLSNEDTQSIILNKISKLFSNVRYLYNNAGSKSSPYYDLDITAPIGTVDGDLYASITALSWESDVLED